MLGTVDNEASAGAYTKWRRHAATHRGLNAVGSGGSDDGKPTRNSAGPAKLVLTEREAGARRV